MKNIGFQSISADHARNAVPCIRPSGKAVIAPFAALLIAAGSFATSGCSKSKSKESAAVQSQAQIAPVQNVAAGTTPAAEPTAALQFEVPKKSSVKGPVKKLSLRTYRDSDSGLSFLYPRKASLEVKEKAQQDSASQLVLPMSYVAAGGTTIAIVELAAQNDHGSGDLFLVNLNKGLTSELCSRFAVESTVSDDPSSSVEPTAGEGSKAVIAGKEYSVLEKTSDRGSFRYYHRFVPAASGDKGLCYEFGMFVNAQGRQELATSELGGRDLFTPMERMLGSVKFPSEQKPEAVETAQTDTPAKAAVHEQATESAKAVTGDGNPR